MIRRLIILGFLSVVVLLMLKDFYKEVIAYNPMAGIETSGKASASQGKEAVKVSGSGWSKDIADSNLFSPARSSVQPKPVLLQAQGKPIEPPKKPELYLKGIILDQFDEYVAYIEKDKARAVAARKGDKLDDVEVVDVTEKNVELKWNDETISLSLSKIKTIKKPR